MIDDIRYLIVFAKVAETGTLSAGAEALDLTPATVSQHIAKLEKNLGTALLYRNTRTLSLTHAGTELLETARGMLALYEKGIIEFKERAITTDAAIRVSVPAILVSSIFMERLAGFIASHPGVRAEITCSDVRDDVIGENIDVAFRIGELPDSTLKVKQLFSLRRTVVGTRRFLHQHPRLEHPRDLEKTPWIGLTMRPNVRDFRHLNGEVYRVRYQPRIKVDSVEASYQLSKSHLGLAAPPHFRAKDDLAEGVIEHVLPEWSLDALRVYAVWPPNVASSSMAYALISAIYDAFARDDPG